MGLNARAMAAYMEHMSPRLCADWGELLPDTRERWCRTVLAVDAQRCKDAAMSEPTTCTHELTVPVQVNAEEGTWLHWCSACGAISSESPDVTNPKGPWFLPGELSEEDVSRVNRAARGE